VAKEGDSATEMKAIVEVCKSASIGYRLLLLLLPPPLRFVSGSPVALLIVRRPGGQGSQGVQVQGNYLILLPFVILLVLLQAVDGLKFANHVLIGIGMLRLPLSFYLYQILVSSCYPFAPLPPSRPTSQLMLLLLLLSVSGHDWRVRHSPTPKKLSIKYLQAIFFLTLDWVAIRIQPRRTRPGQI